ncbi:MAG: GIY-YIG nuclease family protein [Bacilli bacterium]
MSRTGLTTLLNTIIRGIARNNRNNERDATILSSSYDGEKHFITLDNVEFDKDTRNTRIDFILTTEYKTIDKYVTRDYVRYPIYSDTKSKQKTITKKVKLTNEVLENLNNNTDPYISKFCKKIILGLKDLDLIPSWFAKELISSQYQEDLKNEKSYYYGNKCTFNEAANDNNKTIESNLEKIDLYKVLIINENNKKAKQQKKKDKIQKRKPLIWIYICTFGFYFFFCSKSALNKVNNKINEYDLTIKHYDEIVNTATNENIVCKNNLISLEKRLKKEETNHDLRVLKIEEKFKKDFTSIEMLPQQIECNKTGFTPLKLLVGLPYKKIVGCYVIHNKENDKCYVGQSKDVIKRLNQHFHNTKPKNIVFAEDYYNSSIDNRDNLFEIKIYPLSTKNELDDTERELIKKYDSMDNGYNSTTGNS